MYQIPSEKIKETETYKKLILAKQDFKALFLINRKVREIITNGFMIYKNTGEIPVHISGINLDVIKDLIELDLKEKTYETQ
jgi:hypothetical protein